MDSLSDSDSKEDSVIETLPSGSVRFDIKEPKKDINNVDVQEKKSFINKDKFKGFYKTQKTIINESGDSIGDNLDETKNVAEVFEDETKFYFEEVLEELASPISRMKKSHVKLKVKVHDASGSDDATENSEVSVNEKDRIAISKDHENPGIDADIKMSISTISQKTQTDNAEIDHLNVEVETSEDEVSEIISDVPSSTLELKITPSSSSSKSFLMLRSESQESELTVSDLDYYKIRHETQVKEDVQFCLSQSSVKLSCMTNIEGRSNYRRSLPCIKMVDIRDKNFLNLDDGDDTSDEDFSCLESDFMTKEEFIEAHKTNIDLTKKVSKLKVSHSVSEKDEEDSDVESTESMRETFSVSEMSDDSLNMDDPVTNSEEMNDSLAENSIEHSPGCVHYVKSKQKQQFMTLISALDTFKEVDFTKGNSNAEEESFSGIEVTNVIEMNENENTDGEDLTDLEEDIATVKNVTNEAPIILVNGGYGKKDPTPKRRAMRKKNKYKK